jgi:hypothetical protein
MSMNYALQFVDVIDKLSIVYIWTILYLGVVSLNQSSFGNRATHGSSVSFFDGSGIFSFRLFWLFHLYLFWRSGYK